MDKSTAITALEWSFPHSFINDRGEFIANKFGGASFKIDDCNTEEDIKCKVLEWLSRSACKAQPYMNERKNKEFNEFILASMNAFLETSFSLNDMMEIYTRLGNSIDHQLTLQFIKHGMSIKWLMNQPDIDNKVVYIVSKIENPDDIDWHSYIIAVFDTFKQAQLFLRERDTNDTTCYYEVVSIEMNNPYSGRIQNEHVERK